MKKSQINCHTKRGPGKDTLKMRKNCFFDATYFFDYNMPQSTKYERIESSCSIMPCSNCATFDRISISIRTT